MCIVRRTLYFTALLCVGLISALLWMEVHNVPAGSPWHLVVTAAFGAIGALVGASLQLRRRHLVTNDVQADQASVLFRGAFGAVLAVVVALCLQLRIVDFPFLHIDASPNSPLAPAALYVFGFLSGLAEEPFFRRFSRKRAKAPERPPLYEAQPQVDHRLPA